MREKVIDINGESLYAFTNEALNSFCIALYVRAGSLFEPKELNGITHLLEHTIFRNIKKKYGGKLYELLALNGLSFSGSTYREFVRFALEGPLFGYDFACDILCSLFDPLTVSKMEFDLEKQRIKAEIREKDERNSLQYHFSKAIWEDTNNERTVLGYCRVLDSVSLSKLETYRRRMFSAGNCFFYATGGICQSNLDRLAQKLCCLEIPVTENTNKNEVTLSPRFFHRNCFVKVRDSRYSEVCLGVDLDLQKLDESVLDLMYDVLFSGDNCLLFKYLSEDNPLTYSFSGTLERYDNAGCLQLNFETAPGKIEEALQAVVAAVNDLKCGRFHFEAALSYALAGHITVQDNPELLNWERAYLGHILKAVPIDYSAFRLGRFASITKEVIMQAAQEVFRTDNITVVVEGNKRKLKPEYLRKILEQLNEPLEEKDKEIHYV